MPRVVQKPHPPIWIAAISSEESFLYAAKNGFHLMIVPYAGKPGLLQEYVKLYRKVWAESGHQAGAEQIQVAQFCYVAEQSRKQRTDSSASAAATSRPSPKPAPRGRAVPPTSTPATTRWWRASSPPRRRRSWRSGGAFVGTPDEVAAQVQSCIDAFGRIEPSMQINFGGSTDHDAFRTLELFASEVMPRFR